jgi:hypothetical protein
MGSRLVNVRLDEELLRKAQLLREEGLTLSDVVREAIDQRFEQLKQRRRAQDVKDVIQRIFDQYPDLANIPPRGYDLKNRKAARTAIVSKLTGKANDSG